MKHSDNFNYPNVSYHAEKKVGFGNIIPWKFCTWREFFAILREILLFGRIFYIIMSEHL